MLSRWPIRRKLKLAIGMLLVTVAVLSYSGIRGISKYRGVARSISQRAAELPLASEFAGHVSDLRVFLGKAISPGHTAPYSSSMHVEPPTDRLFLRRYFRASLTQAKNAIDDYESVLERNQNLRESGWRTDGVSDEAETLRKIRVALSNVDSIFKDGEDWCLNGFDDDQLLLELDDLQDLATELPSHLQDRMAVFKEEVQGEYRTAFVVSATSLSVSLALIGMLLFALWHWIFSPLQQLLRGSRQVALGEFDHRIHLSSKDEIGELANAMNSMTQRFQEVQTDLNQQVQERTKEVVRNEQLASVGFLAAGVSHEINNPLAAIALCAESLEERLHEIFTADDQLPDTQHNEDISVCRNYLRLIQDEAFRCKGITERLLDFARIGDRHFQTVDLAEAVRDVVEMVGHHGDYREKKVICHADKPVLASVNVQEFKQVVLNLLTNGLDSLKCGGQVTIQIQKQGKQAVLKVIDNGCGMTEEVKAHLFEPFFTRRHDGKGTGLGMSITYRIVNDHSGTIGVNSQGVGKGTTMTVTLPLQREENTEESTYQYKAA